ncbi:hypothetical protein KM176_24655 [Pseudooceanicola sp. CBS1P-1]|uniref:DnaA N-terminal domain-containing protein n=1 Tax=Pseudooceanicola albus TaxID=2692189 RepID=A0A6L7GAP6_9RHOB|nr:MULTISPECIES: DnaA N-terminal domain-containing protein [Pseudooceanicola]MBT9387053.1 hypothetical protein [Pseudooceanicola endophyticus]MXN21135.1 hypothetical protein [Pseudooceanicola albus]
MDLKRHIGQQAGAQKYDLLTALSVLGLRGSPTQRTSMLRLIALITARYNWRNDELTVGQRDMAKLWQVDERTVKREVKRLLASELLLQLRPGLRGKVAAYRLNQAEILRQSAGSWQDVGPDYAARLEAQASAPEDDTIVRVDFATRSLAPAPGPMTPWGQVLERLQLSDPGLFRNWYAELGFESAQEGTLRLRAPSAFVAQYVDTHHLRPLRTAAETVYGPISRIVFV